MDYTTENSEVTLSSKVKSKNTSQKNIEKKRTATVISDGDSLLQEVGNGKQGEQAASSSKNSLQMRSKLPQVQSGDYEAFGKPSLENCHEKGDSRKCEEIIEAFGKHDESTSRTCRGEQETRRRTRKSPF